MSLHKKYRAKFAFVPENPEEAPMDKNELVMALSDTTDGWVKVRTLRNNREGFVPAAYLEEAVGASPAKPAARSIGEDPSRFGLDASASKPAPVSVPLSGPVPAAAPKPAVPSNRPLPRPASGGYGAPAPGFLLPQDASKPKAEPPRRPSAKGEVDYSHQNFGENLALWQERERRFIKGEKELLPKVQKRVYFYYNKLNQRIGPLSEAQMKAQLESNQITRDTFIAPSTGSVEMPVSTINDYFPEPSATFMTAPLPPASSQMWLFIDDQGETQGPFPHEQMREWFNQGYFNENTRAKLAHRTDVGFTKLGALFPMGEGAFLSEGNQAAAVPAVPVAAAPPPPAIVGGPFAAPGPLTRQSSQAEQSGMLLLGMALDNPFLSPAKKNSSRQLPQTSFFEEADEDAHFTLGDSGAYNPFDAPLPEHPVPAAMKPYETTDDWGITWDDEEAGSKNEAVPVPAPQGEEDAKDEVVQPVAKFGVIERVHLNSHDALYKFLTRGLPKDLGTVRCRIVRSMVGMMHINCNVYQLFLEKDDGSLGPEIIVATKHKRMGFDSYFDFAIGSASPTHAGTIIATEVMSALGTQFLLHNDVKAHTGAPKDLVCISYVQQSAGGGPRKMAVAIPGFKKDSDTEFVTWEHHGSIKKSKMMSALMSLRLADLQPLVNKPPVWSSKRSAWTLNFHGRVTKASVKNFQLVRPEDHSHIVLQHGRIGHDSFTMDMNWPISPVQAFAVCISSLHGKLGVE